MNTRSIIASATFVCALAAFLAWLYRAGQVGGAAIGLIAISGLVFVVLTHFFYERICHDDDG
jgi:O-antigen ligase